MRKPSSPTPPVVIGITTDALQDLLSTVVRSAIADSQPAPAPELSTEPIPIAERILRLKETCQLAGVSRHTIADLERAGDFPQRVAITDTVFGYRGDEVLAWRNARPRTRPA